jgi:hypothetical protein
MMPPSSAQSVPHLATTTGSQSNVTPLAPLLSRSPRQMSSPGGARPGRAPWHHSRAVRKIGHPIANRAVSGRLFLADG